MNVLNKNKENLKEDKVTFGKVLKIIKKRIIKEINEFNVKQEKSVFILIDFNLYNNSKEINLFEKTYKIDSYIEEVFLILNNYLSNNDRFCVFIYFNDYQIICPLLYKHKIDSNSFYNDLIKYKNKNILLNNDNEIDNENDINITLNYRNISKEIDFELGENNNISEELEEEIFLLDEKQEKNLDKISGFVKTINYINSYSKMKEITNNEKYFIIFTDLFNSYFDDIEEVEDILRNLNEDKKVIFLLVGANKDTDLNQSLSTDKDKFIILDELILNKFGIKSEIIYFENMKNIKTILSNHNVIKDEILYPNEVYK